MTTDDWRFYILSGVALDGGGSTFWKVGTAEAKWNTEGNLLVFSMRRRKAYGCHRDPSLTKRGLAAKNVVYRHTNRLAPISYDAPVLGSNTRPSPIRWLPIVQGLRVDRKELDQVVAAYADDRGYLIHDRGTRRRGRLNNGRDYRGSIELIDGKVDLYRLIAIISRSSIKKSARAVTDELYEDLSKLRDNLAIHRSRLRRVPKR